MFFHLKILEKVVLLIRYLLGNCWGGPVPKGEERGPWEAAQPTRLGVAGLREEPGPRRSSWAPVRNPPGRYQGGCRFCWRSLILAGGLSLADLPGLTVGSPPAKAVIS